MGHKDLRFGQIVYILVFYNISFSWLLPLDGFRCIFLCRVYCVTVKTKNCFIIVYKGFCPRTENSFTKTVKDYVKGFVIHIETDNYLFTERNDIFKEKNLQ